MQSRSTPVLRVHATACGAVSGVSKPGGVQLWLELCQTSRTASQSDTTVPLKPKVRRAKSSTSSLLAETGVLLTSLYAVISDPAPYSPCLLYTSPSPRDGLL